LLGFESARSISDAAAYIGRQPDTWARGDAYSFAILVYRADVRLGGCGFSQINHGHRFTNVYYWVRAGHTARGIATRAVRLLARFGCERLALQRIEVVAPVGNTPSIRVAGKAGALREGILRNRVILHEVVHDAVMFSLVPQDFVT